MANSPFCSTSRRAGSMCVRYDCTLIWTAVDHASCNRQARCRGHVSDVRRVLRLPASLARAPVQTTSWRRVPAHEAAWLCKGHTGCAVAVAIALASRLISLSSPASAKAWLGTMNSENAPGKPNRPEHLAWRGGERSARNTGDISSPGPDPARVSAHQSATRP